MALRDKLQIGAWIIGMFLILGGWFHIFATRQQTSSLDRMITRWRIDYHLSDEQARRIRAIEEQFHGNGNPFLRPAHTLEETREHHRAVAAKMNPEDGARFFKTQEGSVPSR